MDKRTQKYEKILFDLRPAGCVLTNRQGLRLHGIEVASTPAMGDSHARVHGPQRRACRCRRLLFGKKATMSCPFAARPQQKAKARRSAWDITESDGPRVTGILVRRAKRSKLLHRAVWRVHGGRYRDDEPAKKPARQASKACIEDCGYTSGGGTNSSYQLKKMAHLPPFQLFMSRV